MPPIPHAPANDSPILSFKTSLLQTVRFDISIIKLII